MSLSRLLVALLLTANGRSTSPLMSTNGKFLQQYQEANPVLDLSDNQCFLPASMASHHSRCLYAKGLFVLEMILANPLHTTNYVATYVSKEERAAAKYRVNAIFFAFPPQTVHNLRVAETEWSPGSGFLENGGDVCRDCDNSVLTTTGSDLLRHGLHSKHDGLIENTAACIQVSL